MYKSQMTAFLNMQSSHNCGLIQYPSGRFGLVGSIPEELAEIKENKIGQKYHGSKVFQTKQEGIIALEKLGYTTKDGLNYKREVA